ncbi:MAG: YeeE/YedE family protein [Myxococcales bacterium]|nr:YeeE/YedE family protein [Myxococcales bacterium]
MKDVVLALVGGAMIGAAAGLLLLFLGRIAGVSGIFAGAMLPLGQGPVDRRWRFEFLAGLLAGGLVVASVAPEAIPPSTKDAWILAWAGVLVGLGVGFGEGCTSGHGVCGIGRLSVRSLVATVVFVAVGMMTASWIGSST